LLAGKAAASRLVDHVLRHFDAHSAHLLASFIAALIAAPTARGSFGVGGVPSSGIPFSI
jgi:hypothetical protein